LHPIHPLNPGRFAWHNDHHKRWEFRDGRWISIDEVVADAPATDVTVADAPAVAPAATPTPCGCLTKTYTPDGLVVFSDICTNEQVNMPADGSAASATPLPTSPNYAGRTYQDYLAAHPAASNN